MLCLVRSLKSSLAPINRIPHEVLLLIPGCCDKNDMNQDLTTLTHICRGWRDVFTSCSSLWTRLDFMNVSKTRTYIQRSQSSPLEIRLKQGYLDDAFSLVTPHLRRLKSLTICVDALPDVLRHFHRQAPLLEELNITSYHNRNPILDGALFDGDLSSLRKLSLSGAITTAHLPWNSMTNLKVFNFRSRSSGYNLTQLLDFFESTPLLHTIELVDSNQYSSDAPPQRTVSLPHLNALTINAYRPRFILLDHLCIPTGASLILRLILRGEDSPLVDYFPEPSLNLRNLSHITMINLLFNSGENFVRLSGPSGSLHVLAHLMCRETDPYATNRRIFHSLGIPILSATQRLAVSMFRHPNPAEAKNSPVFRTLSSTNGLRTLILTKCDNLPFILALDPEENPLKLVLCPDLGKLVLYVKSQDQSYIEHLISMAKNRASRGAKLSSITIASLGELVSGWNVIELRKHITDVKYRVGEAPPAWDYIPGESGDR